MQLLHGFMDLQRASFASQKNVSAKKRRPYFFFVTTSPRYLVSLGPDRAPTTMSNLTQATQTYIPGHQLIWISPTALVEICYYHSDEP